MTSLKLSSTKPYLVRALNEWISDNEFTPYIIVNADHADVEVPKQYIEDGRIILNISENAVRDLRITNESLEFNARFNGVVTEVYAPISAILAIYAQENGHGMVFNEDEAVSDASSSEPKKEVKRPDPSIKPSFRVIKND